MSDRAGLYLAATLSAALWSSSALAEPSPSKWTCAAPSLKNSNYTGGTTAYVHLEGFKRGGSYPVTRKGNVATGTTANGTRFTCKAG